jgi:hypothetical protein
MTLTRSPSPFSELMAFRRATAAEAGCASGADAEKA